MNYVITHYFQKEGITNDMMKPHLEYLIKLFERGKLIITGAFTDKEAGGMYIVEVDSEEELNDIVNHDPAILNGLSRSVVRPYVKFLSASELAKMLG